MTERYGKILTKAQASGITRDAHYEKDRREHWLVKLLGFIVVMEMGLWGMWLMVHALADG